MVQLDIHAVTTVFVSKVVLTHRDCIGTETAEVAVVCVLKVDWVVDRCVLQVLPCSVALLTKVSVSVDHTTTTAD